MAQKIIDVSGLENEHDYDAPWEGCEVLSELMKRKTENTPDFLDLKRKENYVAFVYGTLKRDGRLHSYLKHCPYLGRAHTVTPSYKMYDSGSGFPVVFASTPEFSDAHFVTGEAFVVDEKVILDLDMVEGNGYMYDRTEKHVFLDEQKYQGKDSLLTPSVPAFCYIGREDFWDLGEIEQLKPGLVDRRTMYEWKN